MRFFRFKIDIVWQDRNGKTGTFTHWSETRERTAKLTRQLIRKAFLVISLTVTQLLPPIATTHKNK